MQVRKQQLELNMEQQTGSKLGKVYVNAVYCHPAYSTYMQNKSCKKQESSRKTSISALLTMPTPLTVWITIDWKILQETAIPDHLTCLLRNLYEVRKQQLELEYNLNIWKFIVHVLLKPGLENFEHYFAGM